MEPGARHCHPDICVHACRHAQGIVISAGGFVLELSKARREEDMGFSKKDFGKRTGNIANARAHVLESNMRVMCGKGRVRRVFTIYTPLVTKKKMLHE